MADGICIRLSFVDTSTAPDDMRQMLADATATRPVAIAMAEDDTQTRDTIFIACRPDLLSVCRGDPLAATELQFLYADVLRSVLYASLGGTLDNEVLRPKLTALLRSTIH